MTGQLSERYLISEVMELPEQAEDQVYYRILKMAGKSMLEQISEVSGNVWNTGSTSNSGS